MTKICRGTLTIFNEKSLKFHLVTKLPEPPRAPKGSSQYWQLGSLARIIITYCSVMVLLLMIIAIVIIIMIVIIITIVIVIVTVQCMQIRAPCAQRTPCKASALVSFLLTLWA